jgi:hypothetical protein
MAAARWLALAAAALAAAGCNKVLGLDRDPTLNSAIDGNTPIDAPNDVPLDVPIDVDTSACAGMNCGVFGCDTSTNTCRPAKLWVYLTPGQYFGNGFGGTDMPADVRATSDTLCFTEASQHFAGRACSRNRSHAVLTVAGADSIQTMAAIYQIPSTTTEVHRIDDDVLVSNKWDDLIAGATTRAPVASAATVAVTGDGIVWTGFGASSASNCTSWTSKTASGVQGNTAASDQNALWLGSGSMSCGLLERLLCVCWSGGN